MCEITPLLIRSSLVLTDTEHLFMCFMAISMISLEKGPFKSCALIWLGCFFDIEVHKQFVCFGEKFLVGVSVCTYYFHYGVCLFVVFMVSSAVPVLLRGVRSHLFLFFSFIYFLFFMVLRGRSKKNLLHFMSKCVLLFPLSISCCLSFYLGL